MTDLRFYKTVLFVNSLLPLGLLSYDAVNGRLGPNPVEFFLRATGVTALTFVLITLIVTPVRRLSGWNSLIKYRRMLGLFAFFYATVHLVTYSYFDKGLDVATIVADVFQRPFIAVGMSAFLLLIPLAVTSTNGWVKRLGGKIWANLHKLTYLVAVLGVLHFWMIVKSDLFYPGLFGGVLVLLLGWRLFRALRKRAAPIVEKKNYGFRPE